MAWLLAEREFAAARDAVRAGEVTDELYAFIWRLVAATSRSRLLAPALSPTGRWDDDAVAEVVQGWLEASLLRGGLLRAFDRSAAPSELARYLDAALRNWLRSRARAQHRPRLLQRAREILRENAEFEEFRSARAWLDSWWGLAQWNDPRPFEGTGDELVGATYAVPLELLRFSPADGRADPVISNPDLARLLQHVLSAASALLTLRQFDRILRARFAHAFVQQVDPEHAAEPASPTPTALDDLTAEETVREILVELTQRQVEILRGRAAGATLDQLAAAQGCSRGTADNELKRAGEVIRQAVIDDSNADVILEKLLAMTSIEDAP
jgi:hypothetical protein